PVNISQRASALVTSSIDVTIPWKRMIQVRGSISNAAEPGAAVSSFYVSPADDPTTTLLRVANTAGDMRDQFQIDGLPPGTYDVYPTFGKPREAPHVAHVRLTVSKDLQGATMEILPGVEVLGQIQIRRF